MLYLLVINEKLKFYPLSAINLIYMSSEKKVWCGFSGAGAVRKILVWCGAVQKKTRCGRTLFFWQIAVAVLNTFFRRIAVVVLNNFKSSVHVELDPLRYP